jgi:CDP-paratose 2-epimerase
MKILITGSNGLIGGAAVEYFDKLGHEVYGADNNSREKFFGKGGDTSWNRHRIFHKCKNYHPNDTDITNEDDVWSLFHRGDLRPVVFEYDAVIHCAAQPSHDFATQHPELDYAVNVIGTRNMLEATRKFSPNAVFIFTSTNKVYDDAVNAKQFTELVSRFDVSREWKSSDWAGFDESTPTGASNVFGKNKLEADLMVQRYAKEYGMNTMVLRGGCLTGPGHSGVQQHGFLNYLLRCAATGSCYNVFGYKGKQVRDNIHSYDVAAAFDKMIKNPRPGEVYNIGGGRENSISIIEAVEKAEKVFGKSLPCIYYPEARKDDHVCYITDMSKFKRDYPTWEITKSLDDIFNEMAGLLYWGVRSEHEETMNYPELNPNSTVWDIGGYRGQWAHEIYKQYGCEVHIFEPVKEFADACIYRFRDNNDVKVTPYGFAEASKKVMIAKQGVNSSTVRGNENQTPLPIDSVFGNSESEEIFLLDIANQSWDTNNVDIDLVSMNCEGGEYDIMDRLIEIGIVRRFKNIQIQFHDFHPDAVSRRDKIREELKKTHTERYNYPFIWESWKRK